MGDFVNVFLDDLDALLLRLLQFPLAFQIMLWFFVAAVFWWVIFLLLRIKFKSLDKRARLVWMSVGIVASLLVASGVVIDRKWQLMEEELEMRAKQNRPVVEAKDQSSRDLMAAADSVKLERHSDSTVKELIYADKGVQVMRMEFFEHPVTVYLASVDLMRYEVILDTAISEKEQTEDFAKRFNCDIAVNGEAGTSPGMDAPLGQYVGNYVVNGKPIMMKDNAKRPFVYFNRFSKAGYSTDLEVVTELTPEMYNVIWGRFDLILDGKIAIDERDPTKGNPYPRTVVGMDKSGLKLYLLIVDGRRPEYSVGFTMQECGEFLLNFGVHNAMACDQGGSTCMYIKDQGIVNRPADGRDRPVYTHLGLRCRY